MVVNKKGNELLVVHKGDHSIGFYDLESGEMTTRIEIDIFPHEFALTPDHRYAYVSHFGVALAEDEGSGGRYISVIDLRDRRRVGRLDCGRSRRPHGIALDGMGRLFVLSEAASRMLLAAEPLSLKFDQDQPTGGRGSHILSVTSDGGLAFSSNMRSDTVSVLFPNEPKRSPIVIPVGMRPEGSLLNKEESLLYVANRESADIAVIDVKGFHVAGRIETKPGPVRLCGSRTGALLIALYHDRSVAVVDPERPEAQTFIALPEKPVSISYDAETDLAFVSTLGDEVVVLDVTKRAIRRKIETRQDPDPTALLRIVPER
ncbi:MAG: hypothetical protein R3245_11890 [Kiloniellales bacterium]|nr:hypothetical protein [Kiloniellales bacterium]